MEQQRSLEAIFQAFNNLKVLVVGDVMIDSYLWGKSTRISPEAPVPIVNVVKREKRLGGAANVALNVQAMGATPLLCSVIGDDQDGADYLRLMEERALPTTGIVQSPERVTTIKHRIIAGAQQLLRVDSEIEHNLTEYEERHLEERFVQLLAKADVVIFEDYDKGVFSEENIQRFLQLANERGVPSVIDPKKKNFLSYVGCTLFKPNLKELKEGLKVDFADENLPAFEDAVEELQERLQVKQVLVTLSERGVFVADGEEKTYIGAHRRAISDVSGAGDTVISIAALCMALRTSLPFMAGLSNLGGGLVCEQVGVVPIDKTRLLEEAHQVRLFETYEHRIA
ncbi:bifunctional heptose 7-phosphate kinase/heptose 1-phosphate adenyltransferase [Pontibacter akesuensis]|uniref:RfaE bifunctional protein, domain I n=1 Tax=Pontibacter akesuensis TaxID=388950 RepID=A0A1I7H749_9BACT|nr:bifunctional ADP-heptose synthase [Pontibacter akesuensis]GHA52994.1 carbohydrate kinase [Pontibacter akesuensis]SFU56464.1 rfaE bifunctional protein, domain I [Pontibacter akesuensis]